MGRGMGRAEVALICNVDEKTVLEWIKRFNAEELTALLTGLAPVLRGAWFMNFQDIHACLAPCLSRFVVRLGKHSVKHFPN